MAVREGGGGTSGVVRAGREGEVFFATSPPTTPTAAASCAPGCVRASPTQRSSPLLHCLFQPHCGCSLAMNSVAGCDDGYGDEEIRRKRKVHRHRSRCCRLDLDACCLDCGSRPRFLVSFFQSLISVLLSSDRTCNMNMCCICTPFRFVSLAGAKGNGI